MASQTLATDQGRKRGNKDQEYRKRRKVLDSSKTTTDWGYYSTDIPTFGQKGALELCAFLHRLEKVSAYPQTRRDEAAKAIQDLRATRSKNEILDRISSRLSTLPPDNVIFLDGQDSLKKALSQQFPVPLLHKATAKSPSLGSRTEFSLKEFLDYLSEKK